MLILKRINNTNKKENNTNFKMPESRNQQIQKTGEELFSQL